MAQPLSDAEFQAKVLKASKPVLIDFWAPWCGPCKAMIPVIDELSKKYEGKVEMYKINVDENSEVASQFNVMSIPNFMIFKGGEVKDSFVGVKSKDDISARLDSVLQ